MAMLGAAVLTLLGLPCVLMSRRGADDIDPRHRDWGCRPLQETQALCQLDLALQQRETVPLLDDAPAPAIEEIASELRRLHKQRRGGPTCESERWLAAVQWAYDERLCLACRCVGVTEHLKPLEGMDREIERVRVEGALQAAGVALR
jgi:hypothetical protein